MKKLYIFLILFVQIILSYGQVTIDPNDLAILISIRDNAPAESPLKTEWADVSQAGLSWPRVGVDFNTKKVFQLQLGGFSLNTIDISGLTGLTSIDLHQCQLTSLNVSGLTNLESLDCHDNQLTSLNVSGLSNLQSLYCEGNQITSLDFSGLTNLYRLSCHSNQLTSLNLSGCTNLSELYCQSNLLTSLNISGLNSLLSLLCTDNLLTSLDVSGFSSFNQLQVEYNNIPFSKLPLSSQLTFPTGWYYYSPQNKVFETKEISTPQVIDYSSEATIDGTATVFSWYKDGSLIDGTDQTGKYTPVTAGGYYCMMTNTKFPLLTITTNTVTLTASTQFDPNDIAILKNIRDNSQTPSYPTNTLKTEWADESQVGTWAGVGWDESYPKRVRELNVQASYLASLDVSGLNKLENLYCNDNPLTSLNVSGLNNLLRIDCYRDHLTSINVSGLTNLQNLTCGNNLITSLDVSGLTNLSTLSCSNNNLTSLVVSGLTSLQYLTCDHNLMASLSVSGSPNLITLYCDNNLLTSLNLEGLTSLQILQCSVNPITSLNLTGVTNLQALYCSANKLTSVDVSGLSNLSALTIDFNNIPFSKLPLSPTTPYYNPQNRVFEEKEISIGQEIDYSSEAIIDGIATVFYWYKDGTLIDGTDQTGKYTPTEPGYYRCEMTNSRFPGLREITNNSKLQTTSDYDPNDLAILKTIRDNAPASSALKDEWADESMAASWYRVGWSLSIPKKVIYLNIDNVVLTSLDVTGLNNLQDLSCFGNQLHSLNVSGMTSLQTLNCGWNKLTTLNLSGLPNLELLDCGVNQLSSLDVSALTNLKTFSCTSNQLTSLNVSGLSKLEELHCQYNPLGTLDVSGLANLQVLDCEDTHLTSLNLSGATSLEFLTCIANPITSLDLSSSVHLRYFTGYGNQLTSLDVSGLANLEGLTINNNKLTSLKLGGNIKLMGFACNDNLLTSLDVSGLNKLTSLATYDNNIPFSKMPLTTILPSPNYVFTPQNKVFDSKEIQLGQEIDYSSEATIDGTATAFSWFKDDVLVAGTDQSGKYTPIESGDFHCEMTNTKFPDLTLTTNTVKVTTAVTEFDPNDVAVLKAIRDNAPVDSPLKTEWADESQVGTWAGVTWDGSSQKRVKELNVALKELTTLDVSGFTRLTTLDCVGNQLNSLVVIGLINLQTLKCDQNQLTLLNLSGLTNLQWLECNFNKLTSLAVFGLTNLQTFYCDYNQITLLDLSGLINLLDVECYHNQLTSLNLTGLTKLQTISSQNNQLTSMNVSNLTNIRYLDCRDNQLTSLEVSMLTKLNYLYADSNFIPFSQMPLPKSSYSQYSYSPQNKVFDAKEIQLGQGIDYSSEAFIDDMATQFSWFKDGVLITGTDQSGKYTPTESGDYHCEMTNSKFPGLTLTTNTVTVTSGSSLAILKLVSKISNVAIPSGEVWYQLYKKNGNTFMSENIAPVEKGDTTVFSIPQGEWIVLGLPVQNSFSFLPTYVGDVIVWSNAERISIPDKGTVFRTISCLLPETVSLGIGQISGNIYQNNNPGTKSISIVKEIADNSNPLQGVTVQLFKKGGTIPVASDQTDSQGFYKFDQLELSDYEILVEIPGFIQSERFGVTVTENEPLTSVQFSVNTNSNTITDVNDQFSNSFKVYPNPNAGKFTISSGANISSFEIYTMAGEKILAQSGLNRQISVQIDLSNYGKGIYFVKTNNRSESITQKVVVQ